MKIYQYTETDLTRLANQIKEVFLETLVKEGAVQEDLNSLCARYVVMVAQPGLFGKIWSKVRGIKPQDKEDLTIMVFNSPDSHPKEL